MGPEAETIVSVDILEMAKFNRRYSVQILYISNSYITVSEKQAAITGATPSRKPP